MSNELILDIVIEPYVLIIVPKIKVCIDNLIFSVKGINNKSCMMYPTTGKKVSHEKNMHDVLDYGDKIIGNTKHESEISYGYVEKELITLVLDQTTCKRKWTLTQKW